MVSGKRLAGRRHGLLAPVLLAAGLGLIAGCADEPARTLAIETVAPAEGGAGPVWPAGPEVPRYAYVGQLTGEGNFRVQGSSSRSGGRRFFNWLVGLGQTEERPLVLQRPQGVTGDEQGRILVTDVSHQAVFVFDEYRGELLVWPFARRDVRFVAPIGILPGAGGEVLVTDAELGAVFRLAPDGEPLGSFGQGVLQRPTGIARDAERGLIYVADTRGNDVKIFDDGGMLVDFIGHDGDQPGELNAPTYIAFAGGRLYVTDTLNSRVQVFDRDGRLLDIFGERGLYIGNMARPKGITVDDEGNIYVVESYYDYLLVFDASGRFLMPIGGTGNAPGQFYLPAGIWSGPGNRIYVADMFNGRIAIFQFLGGG